MEKIRLDKLAEIIGGQIISRIAANTDAGDNIVEIRKVLVPKSISSEGIIDTSLMPEEVLKVKADIKKLANLGDIVMKLSPPYDAGLVSEAARGCLVPSFCAIVRCSEKIDAHYLLAFMNSTLCKNQLQAQVSGSVMTVLSVGKVKNVCIPVPSLKEQLSIGQRYMESQRKLIIIRQIVQLESKRNNVVFRDLEKSR